MLSPDFDCLLQNCREETEQAIEQGLGLTWDKSPNLESYVTEFSTKVEKYLHKVTKARHYTSTVNGLLPVLSTCPFRLEVFSEHLAEIQKLFDESLPEISGYQEDIDRWLERLNTSIGKILFGRLLTAVQLWKQTLAQPISRYQIHNEEAYLAREGRNSLSGEALGHTQLVINLSYHDLLVYDNQVRLEPPLDNMADSINRDFVNWVSNVTQLSRISRGSQEARYLVRHFLWLTLRFIDLLGELPAGLLEEIQESSRLHVCEAVKYAPLWLHHYTLWYVEPLHL